MSGRLIKTLITGVRLLACGAALFIATRGVPLHDRVVAGPEETAYTGSIVDTGDPVLVQLVDGGMRSIPRRDIVVNARGETQLQYGLSTAWARASKPLLLLAVAVFLVVPFLQGQRLQWLLRAEETHISLWTAVKVSFAGNFLNFAAPLGSTAGDVAKAYYVTQHARRKTEAATIVFIDRAIGLGSLLATVGLIAALSGPESRLGVMRPYMLVCIGAAVLAGTAYLYAPLRRLCTPRWLIARLPWVDQLRRIDRTARSLASRKALVAGAVLNTLVLQLLAAAAFFCVAMALDMRGGTETAVQYYAYFSTGEMVKALPGPPQGLGTAEVAYQYLFAPLGNPSQIVCAAFAIRLVMLLCALPGLAVALTGACQPFRRPRRAADTLPRQRAALAVQPV